MNIGSKPSTNINTKRCNRASCGQDCTKNGEKDFLQISGGYFMDTDTKHNDEEHKFSLIQNIFYHFLTLLVEKFQQRFTVEQLVLDTVEIVICT